MIIQNSSIALNGRSSMEQSFTQTVTETTEGNGWVRQEQRQTGVGYARSASHSQRAVNGEVLREHSAEAQLGEAATLALSDEAREAAEQNAEKSAKATKELEKLRQLNGTLSEGKLRLSSKDELKLRMIQQLVSSLRGKGKGMKFYGVKADTMSRRDSVGESWRGFLKRSFEGGAPAFSGMGVKTTESTNLYQESQTMSFSALGSVTTADGKQISIDLSLNVGREFMMENSAYSSEAVNLCDPLVLNFRGGAAELTDEKFSFDIDCDGTADNISFVGQNSGLLALDLNDDGKVNDGGELFGAASGDGFADLAKYDEDANGWIDENDGIYDRLRIWTKDEDGGDQLVALGVKGVGAIYLGNVSTDFALKNASNETNGMIRSSGLFLYENGDYDTVQQVDLAV